MRLNVVYVNSFREARELSQSPNPLYIGCEGDMFRLHGKTFNEESPPIYVSRQVNVARFMEHALARFHSIHDVANA